MDLKRVLTTVLGLPVVIAIILFGNKYLIGVTILLVSICCMHEYFGAIKKVSNPIKVVGYISNLFIIGAMLFNQETLMKIIIFTVPIILVLLFLKVIITDMKTTFRDVAYTFLGIIYIPFFLMFLEMLRCMENGQLLIGYAILIPWSTDIFAYVVGKNFGKHKFSKISPKKTIEGCVCGIIGAVIVSSAYIFIINNFLETQYSYVIMAIVSAILSTISQVGDFVASTIKRFVDIKDYSNLLPGHGGMLDRTDSLIFIAPFVYLIFSII